MDPIRRKLRVLIADDEALSRERLREFLKENAEVVIVAECASGLEALEAVKAASPDVVFLDVKMPGLDGFGVVANLDRTHPPAVVIVTAHDRFALDAFNIQAVDYLLKPFDRERFLAALAKVRERLGFRKDMAEGEQLSKLLARLGPKPKGLERLTIKSDGRILLVNTADIDWVCAADNYSELHVGATSHLLRVTLSALEEQLPQDRFLRISRSHLINVERVKELRPRSHGDSLVVLSNGTSLYATRSYRSSWVRLLGSSF